MDYLSSISGTVYGIFYSYLGILPAPENTRKHPGSFPDHKTKEGQPVKNRVRGFLRLHKKGH